MTPFYGGVLCSGELRGPIIHDIAPISPCASLASSLVLSRSCDIGWTDTTAYIAWRMDLYGLMGIANAGDPGRRHSGQIGGRAADDGARRGRPLHLPGSHQWGAEGLEQSREQGGVRAEPGRGSEGVQHAVPVPGTRYHAPRTDGGTACVGLRTAGVPPRERTKSKSKSKTEVRSTGRGLYQSPVFGLKVQSPIRVGLRSPSPTQSPNQF
jgi:hypothetical protein